MEQQLYEQKDATLVYRSVLEAAEELDKDEALELLISYIHLGLGDEINLDECSKVVRLILKQNVASLIAADNRHKAAVENGLKGKDSGIKGKEYGKKGGRPRKNETPEEAYKRRNPAKTPQETPVSCFNNSIEDTQLNAIESTQNPAKTPLKEEEEVYVEVEKKEYDKEKEINKEDKYKNLTWEEYLKLFINRHSSFNYDLDFSIFTMTYRETLEAFQRFLLEKTGNIISIEVLTFHLTYYAHFGRVYQKQDVNN